MSDYQFNALRNDIAYYALLTCAVILDGWPAWLFMAIALTILVFRPKQSTALDR